MSALFATMLATHVIIGLVGVIALVSIAMSLASRRTSLRFLKWMSATAVVSFLISWVSGGYYYVLRYGAEVKPIVKAGENPWAHALFMEAKEHVFLFLPVIAVIFALVFFLSGREALADAKYKKLLLYLAILASAIGVFITLSGVIISGSAR